MRQTQEKNIGGKNWTVTQFPAGEGIRILSRLTTLIGPTVAGLAGNAGSISDLTKMDIKGDVLQIAVQQLVSKLDENDTLSLIKRLLSGTRYENKEVVPVFDIAFQGDYLTLFKVLAFVLKVNYGSFFGESNVQGSTELTPNQ